MEFIMAIVPSGKPRLMVGQTYANPLSEGYNNGEVSSSPEDTSPFSKEVNYSHNNAMNEDVGLPEQNQNLNIEKEIQPEEEVSSTSKTLSDHIMNTLKSFGYPYRRLAEFKKKFVKEKIAPDGAKDIQVEIPDQYYPDEQGNIKTIENDEVISISKEISKKFNLNFNGADRDGGKWIIKFVSVIKKEGDEETSIQRDNLDEIYGTPTSSSLKKNNKEKKSFTLNELIKLSKDDILISALKKTIGDKNAS
jgi:hypothetical protein